VTHLIEADGENCLSASSSINVIVFLRSGIEAAAQARETGKTNPQYTAFSQTSSNSNGSSPLWTTVVVLISTEPNISLNVRISRIARSKDSTCES
jgi:hypothetical protein